MAQAPGARPRRIVTGDPSSLDPSDGLSLRASDAEQGPGPVPDDAWVHGALARGMPWAVAQTLPHLPESPGVYLWKDADGRVLYVGKAKRLRARVRWYWSQDHAASPRTRGLLRKVAALETIVVPSEAHALVLEATLIKEHHPRFNVALRDDKTYPCIKVTVQEPFPRVIVTRRLEEDGARYFGPYTDVGAMRRALNVVKRLFTVRSCHYALPREAPERPCLDYHIQRCKAPCVGYQSAAEYGEMIDEVVWFLEGKTAEVVRRVQGRMVEAAERLDFERAAELRDVLRHLERMEEPTVVLEVEGGDRDVVGYARDGDDACVVVLRVRGGALLAREHRLLEHAEEAEDGDVLGACLAQWYRVTDPRASELLVPFDFADREALAEALAGAQVRVPQRGSRRALVDLADQNARHLLEEFKLASLEADERAAKGLFLSFQYPLEIPGVPALTFIRTALNAQRKARGEAEMSAPDFLKRARACAADLKMDFDMLKRPLNVGFSGGEKKRMEILQMALLSPRFMILDETDSGLDIDALRIVSDGVNALRGPDRSMLVITHYQRLLDYIRPDRVHVLADGRIAASGGPELALELEREGYDKYARAA